MSIRVSLRNGVIISNLFRLLMVFSAVGSIIENNYINVLTACVAFALSYLPSFLRKKRYLYLPVQFQIVLTLFFFASLYLGSIKGFYYRYWWWDTLLHTASGFMLGLVGFLLVYTLNSHKRKAFTLSPFFIVLFSFCFAMTIGTMWEIYEFSMDSLFGWDMQKSGLVDTMFDLIADMIGAATSSIYGYIYIREHHKNRNKKNRHHDIIDTIRQFKTEKH
ncbi:MAG TPA: hypothetical protein ENN72_06635 [Firmicutes bacterium]|nr:hypothetical protein [Bacillota bacterium]